MKALPCFVHTETHACLQKETYQSAEMKGSFISVTLSWPSDITDGTNYLTAAAQIYTRSNQGHWIQIRRCGGHYNVV